CFRPRRSEVGRRRIVLVLVLVLESARRLASTLQPFNSSTPAPPNGIVSADGAECVDGVNAIWPPSTLDPRPFAFLLLALNALTHFPARKTAPRAAHPQLGDSW